MDCTDDEWYELFVDPKILNDSQIVFLVMVYGYILFQASNYISDGSELLLLVPKAAPLVGSVVLPVLGAVPDGMMVLCSGLGSDARSQVAIGVGTLAGSTVMLLTIPWFLAVYAGRVSLADEGTSLTYKRPADATDDWDKLQPPGSKDLFKTGVGLGKAVKDNSVIMVVTSFSYLIMQIPAMIVDDQSGALKTKRQQEYEASFERWFAFGGFCLCMIFFCGYLYKMWRESQLPCSAVHEKIATTTVVSLKEGTLTLRGAMAQFREHSWATLCTMGSENLNELLLNTRTVEDVRRMCRILAPFFALYDVNGDNQIDFNEFCMICKDLHENLSKESQSKMFDAADVDKSGSISFEEFVACLMSFALDPPGNSGDQTNAKGRRTIADSRTYIAADSDKASQDDDDDDEAEEDVPEDLADLDPEEQQRQIKLRSLRQMGLGTILILLFSGPMVNLMGEMALRLHIGKFYVAFVLAPIASNASELVAAYNYAKKRTQKSITTSLSTLVGAGIMNNTFCLGIFFALVFAQGIPWEFSAETISIVLVEILVAAYAMTRKIMKLIDAFVIVSFYAGCVLTVWCLENISNLD